MKRLSLSAFTLMELLVVMAIIAGLVGILLPAVMSAGKTAKNAQAVALIRSIGAACNNYQNDYGFYPPESLADNGGHASIDKPAESLYFFLGKKFVYKADEYNFNNGTGVTTTYNLAKATVFSTKNAGPYLQVSDNGIRDFDGDGVPGLIDPYGQPILYNTIGGPYGDSSGGKNHVPFHNTESFDIFSVGANGTSRQADRNRVFSKFVTNAATYKTWLEWALNDTSGGNDTQGQGCNEMTNDYRDHDRDDINNWNYK